MLKLFIQNLIETAYSISASITRKILTKKNTPIVDRKICLNTFVKIIVKFIEIKVQKFTFEVFINSLVSFSIVQQ